MNGIITLLVLSLITVFVTEEAFCQEVEIPIDTMGKIEYIDKSLAKQLDLFPEIENIQEIRLFKVSDSSFVLEISNMKDEKLARKRISMSKTECDEFKIKVTNKISGVSPNSFIDQEGRAEFLGGTILLSLGYWGWVVPDILGIEDGSTYTGTYMISAGLGFFIPYFLTQNSELTKGTSRFALYGAYTGLGHGMMLYDLFGGSYNYDDEKKYLTVMTLTSIAELLVNYNIAKNNHFTSGHSSGISCFATYGPAYGLAISALGDLWDQGEWSGTMLLTTALGYTAGYLITHDGHYAEGDAVFPGISGILGASLPFSILMLAKSEDLKAYMWTMMLGATAGLWYGDYLARNYNLDDSQATYLSLATIGGALIGSGFGLLTRESSVIPVFALGGAVSGFSLLFSLYSDETRVHQTSGNLKLDLNPLGFASGLINKTRYPVSTPVLKLSYRLN